MRNIVPSALVAALLVGCAAGCSLDEAPVETPVPKSETPQPVATATALTRPGTQEEIIVYARTGGIAGISEQWSFLEDGSVFDAQGVEYSVSDSDIADLIEEMDALGFFAWQFEAPRLGSCADCFTYSIAATYDGQSSHVTFLDGQQDVPEEIWSILEAIQDLLEEAVEKRTD